MQEVDFQTIREARLFSTMSDARFEDLVRNAVLKCYPADVQVIAEGEPADFLHILLEGTIELFGRAQDHEATMLVLRPKDSYNLSAVLESAVYLMSARTLDESRILMIPGEDLREVMNEDRAFAGTMIVELAKRYRTVLRSFKEERLRTSVERLANYLLRVDEQRGRNGFFELTENKRTLAALLGMSPECLSRAFTQLKKYGVEVQGRRITLSNLDALVHFAKPDPLLDRRST